MHCFYKIIRYLYRYIPELIVNFKDGILLYKRDISKLSKIIPDYKF